MNYFDSNSNSYRGGSCPNLSQLKLRGEITALIKLGKGWLVFTQESTYQALEKSRLQQAWEKLQQHIQRRMGGAA